MGVVPFSLGEKGMERLFDLVIPKLLKVAIRFLVKCDAETTTQADIDAGIVNVLVGFAPLKPAEFVVVSLQLMNNSGS